jgi:hemin uptake protein HemP
MASINEISMDPKILLKPMAHRSGMNNKQYSSNDLFGNQSAIQIDHRGVIYTLRITQLGKLILTK